ncbi:MAG: HK97 gp10 family phage protein [Enterococcus sp.]|uniref:HK97 gp10 family phage protein n=1 Tax=unclassified Enterococcus TaxID=2608891 RepID=UPI00206B87B9|nr:MAG TPA: tail component [Caudoviricetes sp.]DAM22714.1 MAG TPA: tail component [Caudoviricetes sp.]
MSVSVEGMDDIIKNIEAKLGTARTTRVINKALKNYGNELKKDVEEAVSSYIDTGETHDTVIVSGVKKGPPKRVEVGWGAGSRWRLVHLSEFGYTRFGKYVSPRGMGKLQGVVDKTEGSALQKLRSDMEELAR